MGDRIEDWPEEYARKLVSAEEAARLVRNGDGIGIPTGGLVTTLIAAVFARADELDDIHTYIIAPINDPGWFEPGHPAFNMHVEVFSTPPSRGALASRRADFTSVPFSLRYKGADERGEPVHHADVALIGVSPPDHLGYCSFGMSMWNSLSLARRARTVIAEIHPGYPRTHGDSRIHVSEIDAFVEEGPLPERVAVDPLERFPADVAGYVSEIVKDGDTIQVGTGSLTNGLPLAGAFDEKEDLGVHAELSVPGMTQLVRKGIINGVRKSLHRGKYVSTQLEASQPGDIEFIDDNPGFAVFDVSYVNDPLVISQNENINAINNALAIDFTGQITAESIGGELWSGPGGQQDFALGAMMAKGGRNVTLIRSAARGGEVSNIVPRLPEGAIVTVPRQFADYVVTEHGVARLFGKSDRERAHELIAIAHPGHRSELERALEAM